jgi:hypothetical protein
MKKHFLIFSLVILCFGGCEKDAMPVSPSSGKGSVKGYFYLLDSTGSRTVNNTGIQVTLIGTTYTTETDSAGNWMFNDIPASAYSVRYSKEGYVSKELQNVLVQENGTLYYDNPHSYAYLGPYPDFIVCKNPVISTFRDDYQTIFRDSTYFNTASGHDTTVVVKEDVILVNELMTFSFTVSLPELSPNLPPEGLYCVMNILYSKNAAIDPNDTSQRLGIASHWNTASVKEGHDSTFHFTLKRSEFIKAGYHSGDVIYCAASTYPDFLSSYHWDPYKRIYTHGPYSKNHTEVKSFILP